MLLLLNTPAFEDIPRWLARGRTLYLWMMGVGLTVGILILLIMTAVRIWWRTSIPKASTAFVAGLCVAYLLMPLVHHVSYTDGYYYISSKDNFFTRNALLQVVVWLLALAVAMAFTRLWKYLATRRKKPQRLLSN